ncbi:hypothetical protein [Desulfococcus sp.]|uniref:hypothetical protein n=1 Tax=Desulfococcus sp. TaxID=2025834 RepID=UPI003594722B
MDKRGHRVLFWVLPLICLFTGCVRAPGPMLPAQDSLPAARFFEDLDAAVEQAGVRDAGAVPVAGFPYLRADRFLAAMAPGLLDGRRKDAWTRALEAADRAARRREIANLPPAVLSDPALGISRWGLASPEELLDAAAGHARALSAHDRSTPDFVESVAEAVRIPDEYRTAMRIMGLYPVAVVPVSIVTEQVQQRFAGWHREPWDRIETRGRLSWFSPVPSAPATMDDIRRIHGPDRRDALGVPRLDAAEADALVRRFAPVIVQDDAGEYDRWGRVAWGRDGPRVDGRAPVLYHYISHAFFKSAPILQINYTLWYPARKGPGAPRIEHGILDGLTIRVSLDTAGSPFMVDVMNNCGCYHFFVPQQRRVLEILPQPGALSPFVPRWLPERFPEERLLLRVNSGWHQVVHLGTVSAAAGPTGFYGLLPYEALESLPRPDGTSENLFDPEGIAKGSERIEPYLFFSMGIPRVGSMRQRGHHAIRLVGRAHFDDPSLFDKTFRFK